MKGMQCGSIVIEFALKSYGSPRLETLYSNGDFRRRRVVSFGFQSTYHIILYTLLAGDWLVTVLNALQSVRLHRSEHARSYSLQ